jgi:hypothetical protein
LPSAPPPEDEHVVAGELDAPVRPAALGEREHLVAHRRVPVGLETSEHRDERRHRLRPPLPNALWRVEAGAPHARVELEVEGIAEEPAEVDLVAPARGIRVLRSDACDLVDGFQLRVGAPGRQAESAARPADARELARDGLVVRGEDGAEARGDDVEGRVLVGQVLGVALVPADGERVRFGARLLEQRRGDVDADDLRARPRSADRDRAASGRDVEPALGRPRLESRDKLLVDRRQPLGDEAVVAAGPEVRLRQRRVPRTT